MKMMQQVKIEHRQQGIIMLAHKRWFRIEIDI